MIVICRGIEVQFDNDVLNQVENIIQSLDRYNIIQVSAHTNIMRYRYIGSSATKENLIVMQIKYHGYVQD